MTDPTSNDLPVPTPLSPAAQAVLDAALFEVNAECDARWIAAAVIRAVTDLPNELEIPFNVITDREAIPGTCASFYAAAEWGYNQALAAQRAIATELEGHG